VKQTIAVIAILALIAGQIGLVVKASFNDAPATRLSQIAPRPQDLAPGQTLETIAPYADLVAHEWDADAKLVEASMQIDWPDGYDPIAEGTLPVGGWLLLGYATPDKLLTMRIDRGSGTIVDTAIVPLTHDLANNYLSHPIMYGQGGRTSDMAVLAFEIAYGTAFRNDCSFRRPQSWVVPTVGSHGLPVWHISYVNRHDDQPADYLSGDLDSETGAIENVTGQNLQCEPKKSD